METRLTCPQDAPRLAELHKQSFADAPWSLAQIEGSLALPSNQALVVEKEGKIFGFILYQHVTNEAEVLTFCVGPDARRQGIGNRLFSEMLARLRQQNIHRLFLEVASDNSAALALYKNHGLQISGVRHDYYERAAGHVDALTMTLCF